MRGAEGGGRSGSFCSRLLAITLFSKLGELYCLHGAEFTLRLGFEVAAAWILCTVIPANRIEISPDRDATR